MHSVSKQAIVAYSTEKMYRLVNDVNSYPEFLAWCESAAVISEHNNQLKAYIQASKGPFNQKFSTINTLIENEQITMKLLDGPFKELEGIWRFTTLDENVCKVSFDLQFSFATKLLDIAFSKYFKQIINAQLDAFVTRAGQIY